MSQSQTTGGSHARWPPPPPAQERMPGGQIGGLIALSCCLPVIGPIVSLVIGITQSTKSGAVAVIIVGAVMLLVNLVNLFSFAAISLPNYLQVKDKAKEAELKGGLHNIELAVERFAVDNNGSYPAEISVLTAGGYLASLPRNPFEPDQGMRQVEFGDAHDPGTFTYIMRTGSEGQAHYYLILYGAQESHEPALQHLSRSGRTARRPIYDVDGDGADDNVILVLSNDDNCTENLKNILSQSP